MASEVSGASSAVAGIGPGDFFTLLTADFEGGYRVNIAAAGERLAMTRFALSLLAAPFAATIALVSAKVQAPISLESWNRVPGYLFGLLAVFGVLAILPYLRMIEASITHVRTARPYSKSGWVSLTVPGERPDAVPCLTGLAFRARRQALQMSVVFRSQNAYTCYLNYLPLRDVQAEVATALGLPSGAMRVFVDVPHLYVADAGRVGAILSAAPAPEAG